MCDVKYMVGTGTGTESGIYVPVNAVGEGGRLVQREAGCEEGCVVKHPDNILDGLVTLVGTNFLS